MTKYLIIALLFSSNLYAQEVGLKGWLRPKLNAILGEKTTTSILGPTPVEKPEVIMPIIPKLNKNATDITSYTRKEKDKTEFEKLPVDQIRKFNFNFIRELYSVVRGAEATDEDLSKWLNSLEEGGSREGVFRALVLDEVYYTMEATDNPASEELIQFTLKYSEKFLAQSFKAESLNKINEYYLKRLITEKTLEVLDQFEISDLDALYRWYGVFSSDIASNPKYSSKAKVRAEKSSKYHYEWAKGMPIQHIKGEVILKLYTMMDAFGAN